MILAWLGCSTTPHPKPPPEPVATYQCERCHSGQPLFASASEEESCVGCHQAILRGEYDRRYLPGRVDAWKRHLHRLNEVPSLDALSERVTRSWFVRTLLSPVDLRPALPAMMPRLPVSRVDAEAIADLLHLSDPRPADLSGDSTSGAALIAERCLPCHSGADPLAIDLSFVRERSAPQQVDRWLSDPQALLPQTRMPNPALSENERADIVAALFLDPPQRAPLPSVPAPVRVDRAVSWEEVNEAVFHEVCRHCHADPVPVGGDGGPGNTGGFGYTGTGLDLSSEAALLRRSELLMPDREGQIPLVKQLWARHREVAGQDSEVLGMPLGLPPLPPETIALVEAWARGY